MKKQTIKILIIDDSAADRAAFRHFLLNDDEFAYSFLEAELGEAGLKTYLNERPDCVLLDYNLPDTDGLTVVEKLNPDPLNPAFPVILLTGAGDEKLAVKAIKSGAQDYLVKGNFSAEELALTIRNAIEIVNLRGKHKQSEENLHESEVRYRSLFELAAVGIARANGATGQFEEVNDEFCRITGYSREELLGLEFPELTHPDDRAADREMRGKLAHSKENQATYTKRYVRKDGQTIWVQITATIVRDADGKVEYGVSIVEDITESRAAEGALRESGERYRALVEASSQIVWTMDAQGESDSHRHWFTQLTGKSIESIKGKGYLDFIHPDDREYLQKVWKRVSKKPAGYEVEFRLAVSENGYRYFNLRGIPLFYDDGSLHEWVGTIKDVTDARTAQNALHDSEAHLRVATDAAEIYAWEVDVNTQTIKYAENHARVLGFALPADVAAMREILHPDDRAESLETFQHALENGTDFEFESRLINPSTGAIVWICTNGIVLKDGAGNPARVFGVVQNITRRKEAEHELLENQRFTQSIVETAPTVLYTFNLDTKTNNYLTKQAAQVLGYSLEELKTGQPHFIENFMHPDDAPAAEKHFRKIAESTDGEVFEFEYRMRHKSGEWRWFRSRDKVFKRDKNGKAAEILGIALDITERKRAEEQLKLAAERNEIAQEAARASLYEYIPQTDQVIRNESFASVLGYAADEVPLTGEAWQNLIHPDDLPESLEIFGKGIESHEGFTHEYRVRHKDGHYIWLYDRARALCDEQGNIERVVGMIADITTRKQAEHQLRESEEFNRTVLENSPDCVKILDGEGRLQFMNTNGLCLLEIDDFAPFRNKFWWEMWTDEAQPVVKESIEKALRGETANFQAFTPTAKGTPKWWDVVVSPVPGADGKPSRLISVSRDVTAQKRRELNLAFLAETSADFAPLFRAEEIMERVGSRLAAHLDLSRCNFAIVDEEADLIECIYAWRRDDSMPDVSGAHRISTFLSEEGRRHYAAGNFAVINDVRNSSLLNPATLELYDELDLRSIVDAPYLKDGRWKFQLTAARSEVSEWRTDEIELIRELAERIYIRIERARAEENLITRNRQLDLLARTSRQLIVGEKSEAEILQTIFDQVAATLETEFYFNFMAGDEPETLRLLTSGGLSQAQKDFFAIIKFGEYLCGTVAERRERCIVEKLQECEFPEADALRQSGVKCYAGFPLVAQGELIGTVAFATRSREHFREGELQLIQTVCDQVAITLERTRTEANLRESEERFRSLFDSIDEGFCIIEMIFDENNKAVDYLFVQANPALERLTGLKDAIGKTIREMVPDLEEYWFEFYGNVALTGEAARVENEATAMNRWFEIYASRVGDSSNRVAVVFNNITERKEIEARREQLLQEEQRAREAAEAANVAKDEFLAVLSHELRSPLNSILGWATMLNNGTLNEEMQKQAVGVIERNIRLQNSLIEDLLDVSRIISGKMRLESENISLISVVQNAVEAARPAGGAKNIKMDVAFDCVADEMHGDANRLQQLIGNLLTNAIKFTPENGAVNIVLECRDDTAKLTIEDNGIGIGAELLPRIFERFRQADGSSRRHFGGLGLGLTIVKHLAEMHGGRVFAESEGENKGATFTVELPLIKSYTTADTSAATVENDENYHEPQMKILENIKLLVVDDDADALDLLRFVLELKGAAVTCVGSADEAWHELQNNKFNLLISDLGMAGTDGFDLIRRLRTSENEEIAALPAIALTGYVSAEDRERVLRAGFQIHLPKPLDIENLPAIVLNLISRP